MNRDELKTVISNELKAKLPEAIPGLTKLAYEQIIEGALNNLPKNLDKFLEKEADAKGSLTKEANIGNFIGEGFGKAIGGAAAAALAGGAIVGLRSIVNQAKNNALRPSFEQSLRTAMSGVDPASEILRNNKQKVRSFAETIFNFAPHAACDPNILKGILAHVIQGDSIDPQTIRSLMEIEEKQKNLQAFKIQDVTLKG